MALNLPGMAVLYDDLLKQATKLADDKWNALGSPKRKENPS